MVCDVACHTLSSIPAETIKLVAERLRDTSVCLIYIYFVCDNIIVVFLSLPFRSLSMEI